MFGATSAVVVRVVYVVGSGFSTNVQLGRRLIRERLQRLIMMVFMRMCFDVDVCLQMR